MDASDPFVAWYEAQGVQRSLIQGYIEEQYAGEVHYLDDRLAEFWDELQTQGDLDSTLVTLWTDHGEQMQEHGHWGHNLDLYGEEVDAVWFVWSQDLAPHVFDTPSTHADIAPTLLDMMGLDPLPSTGRVLGAAEVPLFSVAHPAQALPAVAVEIQGRKLVHEWGEEELFFDRRSERRDHIWHGQI